MENPSQPGLVERSTSSSAGRLFGVPLGDLGWFTSLLMSGALAFAAFFAATFFGIVILLVSSTAGHHPVDYSLSYRWIGFPAGLLVGAFSLLYLGSLWIRRQTRGA